MTSLAFTPVFAGLALRGGFPWWLAVAMGVAAVGAVVLLYLRESSRVPVAVRLVLAGLRGLTLAFILFLLLRPTWLTEQRGERPRPVGLLFDDSQSMKSRDPRTNFADNWRTAIAYDLADPARGIPEPSAVDGLPAGLPRDKERPARVDVMKKALTNPRLNLIEKLRDIGPLEAASFGGSRTAVDTRGANWADEITGGKDRTAIADAAFALLRRDDNELPAAIVIATDGRENGSARGLSDLARECERRGVPLHVYGVGCSAFSSLQIRDLPIQDTLFVDDNAVVPIRYRAKGFKEGKVEFTATLDGKEVELTDPATGKPARPEDVTDGDDVRRVLTFEPKKADAKDGQQELVVTVRVTTPEEVFTDEIAKSVRVVESKLKVLFVDFQPRWDFKFIQRALLRDRRVSAKFILLEGDPTAMRAGPPFLPKFPANRQELFEYDLLILGDIPADYLSRDQQDHVMEFVKEGGGLIHIAGRGNGPASWVGTPLADLLPVEFAAQKFATDSGKRQEGYRPELTPAGSRSLMMSLDDNPEVSQEIWKALPELYWHYPVTKLKPASDVFLAHPTEKTADGKPMPLLAAHYYGKGYVLFSAVDETWRWRFNEADKYFGRFWSQGIYVTGVRRTMGTKMTQLSLDKPDAVRGTTGQVYARLYTPDLKPLTTDRLEARAERLDVDPGDKDRSFPVELKAVPGQDGEYVATLPFNRVGRYTLKVDNGGDTAVLDYRVTLPPDDELAPGGMAEEQLRKLAESTQGRFYREEDLHLLPTAVTRKMTPFVVREELLLWNWWALAVVAGLFALEWFVRKFNSLS
jgi:uncharacterized membrane protein